jgi:hypothetical protein
MVNPLHVKKHLKMFLDRMRGEIFDAYEPCEECKPGYEKFKDKAMVVISKYLGFR